MIHDNYWIYLNGHIVSAPPHHAPDAGSRNFVSVKTHDGWEIWTKDGLILRSIHDQGWDNRYDPYALSLASRDALHLFQAVDLPLRAGKYSVDLATLSGATLSESEWKSSFPFVFTGAWDVDVQPGRTRQLFLQVPEHFDDSVGLPAAMANRLCNNGPHPPTAADLDSLQRTIKAYMDDPTVRSLRAARASLSSTCPRTKVDRTSSMALKSNTLSVQSHPISVFPAKVTLPIAGAATLNFPAPMPPTAISWPVLTLTSSL